MRGVDSENAMVAECLDIAFIAAMKAAVEEKGFPFNEFRKSGLPDPSVLAKNYFCDISQFPTRRKYGHGAFPSPLECRSYAKAWIQF